MRLKPGVYDTFVGILNNKIKVYIDPYALGGNYMVSEEDLSDHKLENIGWGMYGQNECEEDSDHASPETETHEEIRKRKIWEAIQAVSTGG